MKTHKKNRISKLFLLSIVLLSFSCTTEDIAIEESNVFNSVSDLQNKISHSDQAIAARYAPWFYQDVDITDGFCRNQSKSGSADWITKVDYDGDWKTGNNWDNMVSARNSGKLIPYVYYYVTYTETHFFILYSVYHPRDWTDIPFLCSLDTHENDFEAVLITANRKSNGGFGGVIDAQTIFHTEVLDYSRSELRLRNDTTAEMFIEAKGHGIRAFRGSSDTDDSYIRYYYNAAKAVSPDKDSKNLPQNVHYNLLPLETTLWLQRDNRETISGTALVGNNGDGSNRASAPWGWENGRICKNPAQYLKDKYGWTNFSTKYISDTPIQ